MPAAMIPYGDSVTYRQQYTRCGKPECRRCTPGNPGHGPYWYAYWREGGRVRSRYLGKLPPAAAGRPGASAAPAGEPPRAAEPRATPAAALHEEPPALRVRTLGGLQVWRGAAPIPAREWRRRKAAMLLALLVTRPGRRINREQAGELLWPDATADQMLINLRTTLHLLRKILNPTGGADHYIETSGEWLVLQSSPASPGAEPDPDWWDAETFARAAAEALAGNSIDRCRAALRHYQGDFLAEFPYEDWIAAPREALRRQYLALLLHLATLCSRQDELPEAIQALNEALATDPGDEEAARLQMRLLTAAGQRTAALRVYSRLAETLDRDLNVEPAAETVALQEAITYGRPLPVAGTGAGALPVRPAQPPIDALLPKTLRAPLVGRERALADVRAVLQRTRSGHGSVVLLSGMAGVGKSRVLEELLREAAGSQMLVLWGRAYQAEGRLPYGPLLEALRGYVAAQPAPSLARQLGAAGPILLSMLPELSAVLPATAPAAPLDAGAERHRLFAALAGWLQEIARAAPVVLALDDLQWADAATLQSVHYLARTCREVPLVLCITHRQESPGGALARLIDGLREGGALSIALSPLDEQEARSLVTALLAPDAVAGDVLDLICQKGQGSPLLLEELVQVCRDAGAIAPRDGRWELGRAGEIPVPASIRALLVERLERLDATAKRLLRICAVLGDAMSYPVLRGACGLHEEALLDALESAELAGLLRETASGYRFHHPLLRDALYQSIPRPRRRYLHGAVAEALADHAGARTDGQAALLAWHFGQAEDHVQAGRYAMRAATQAAAMHANGEAIAHLLAARDHLGRADGNQEIAISSLDEQLGDLRLGIGDLTAAGDDYERARQAETNPARLCVLWQKEGATWEGRGLYDRALAAYEQAAMHAARSSDRQALLASLEVSRGIVHYRRGDYDAAEAAVRALASGDDAPVTARAANVLGNVARARARLDQATQWHRRSLAIWERLPAAAQDPQAMLGGWGNLGITAYVRGDLEQARAHHLRSLAIAERIGDQRAIAYSWYNLAMVGADRGELAEAEAYQRRSLALRETLEDRFNGAFSLDGLGQIAYLRGDLAQADDCYMRALAIWEQLGAASSTAPTLARRGVLASERGDLPGAAALLRQARRLNQRHGGGMLALPFMLAEAHLRQIAGAATTDRRRARLVVALVTAGAAAEATAGSTRYAATAALLLAALHRHGGALAESEHAASQARQVAEASGRRREAALARRLLGQCAGGRGDWTAALAELRAAAVQFEEMGAALELARTRLALAEALVRAPADATTGQAPGFTARDEARRLLEEARHCFAASGTLPDLARADRAMASAMADTGSAAHRLPLPERRHGPPYC